MNTTITLVRDTFREAFARKIFWGLFGLSTLMILFFLFLLRIDLVEGAMATFTLFGKQSFRQFKVEELVAQIFAGIAAFLYTFGMLLAVFASAGLIPSVLEAGRIELVLSKPVSRVHILLGRYLGNLLVVAVNIAYLVLGVWLIVGAKANLWEPRFLMAIVMTIAIFAVLLTVVVLVGVAWESTALSTMITMALMVVSPILAQEKIMSRLLSSEWSRDIWKGLYWALPKVYDMGVITREITLKQPVESWMPLWSSGLFAASVLMLAIYVFMRRDF